MDTRAKLTVAAVLQAAAKEFPSRLVLPDAFPCAGCSDESVSQPGTAGIYCLIDASLNTKGKQ